MEQKNIIIIGTSRCGKSTIANRIIGKDVFTINSRQSSFDIYRSIDGRDKAVLGKNCEITVIDAASLNSRDFSKENIEAYLRRHGVEWINLVIFVIRAGRLTGIDKKVIVSGLSTFSASALQGTCALAISHCEQFNERRRESIVQDFKQNAHTKEIAKLMGKGIITTGIPAVEEYNDELYKNLGTSIDEDTAKLNNLIDQANDKVDLSYMFRHSYFDEILKACVIL